MIIRARLRTSIMLSIWAYSASVTTWSLVRSHSVFQSASVPASTS